MLAATALGGIPEVTPELDLAAAIVTAISDASLPPLRSDDVVCVAHKVISKLEGRVQNLADVRPGVNAERIAARDDKDPRHVQVVLDETAVIVRDAPGVLITQTRHGFVCANAGVDASNVPGDDTVLMLPLDPDASARRLRSQLHTLTGSRAGVLISDSFGRAWRIGQADVAIGLAGVAAVEDWRGASDAYGREMRATVIAVADLLAGSADLARRKNAREPVVLIRGAGRFVSIDDGPGAGELIREREQDLFR